MTASYTETVTPTARQVRVNVSEVKHMASQIETQGREMVRMHKALRDIALSKGTADEMQQIAMQALRWEVLP